MKTYQILYYLLISLGIVTSLFKWKQLSRSSRWSAVLLIVTIASELGAHFLKIGSSNFPFYHFFIPAQFLIVTYSFNVELQSKKLILVLVSFLVFSMIAGLTFQPLAVFPSYTNLVSSFLMIIYCFLFLRALLDHPEEYSFLQYPLFWISSGWMVFNVLTLFNFGSFNYFLKSADPLFYGVLKNIRIGSNYFLYGCYLVSFLTPQRHLNKLINN